MRNIFLDFILPRLNKFYLFMAVAPACLVPIIYHFGYTPIMVAMNTHATDLSWTHNVIYVFILEALALLLLFQSFHTISAFFLAKCLSGLRENIKLFLFDKIARIDIMKLKNHDTSSIEKQFTEFTDSVCVFIRIMVQNVLPFFLSVIMIIILSFSKNPIISYMLIGWVFVFSIVWVIYTKRLHQANQQYSTAQARESDLITENIRNLFVNQMFPDSFKQNRQKFISVIEETNKKFSHTTMLLGWSRLALGMLNGVLFVLFVLLVFIMYQNLEVYGLSSVLPNRDAALLFASVKNFISTLWDVMNSGLPVWYEIGRITSLTSIVQAEERYNGNEEIKDIQSIEIRNLNYSYGDKIVFTNFNLTIKKGETVLLSGASGSGKSTLIRLITGVQAAPDNTVFINDKDINTLNRDIFVKNISLMTQGDRSFHYSIRENIACGNSELNDNQIKSIAKQCYLDSCGLPLNHQCGFGNQFVSGGQAQMIALSRTAAKTIPKIKDTQNVNCIVLDECFASCDKNSVKRMLTTFIGFQEKGYTIIMSDHSHNAELLKPRVIELSNS
jgi:ABC-type multidrug transport system fused ATPase/permease subunit